MTFAQPFSAYEIEERIGSGAMGTVFRARHRQLGKIVALKVLRPSLARDARYVERLRREARIVASLEHPNIVGGYDLGEENGYHFFVMEHVQGRSLRELLAEWGMFQETQILDVGIQVAAALDHAFQRGVIHRDVKPGNILITERSQVKLTDMGLAKGPSDATITRDGGTVGTPQYISPEQARSPQDADIRSDLYSLGATLYHMATGAPPFRGETMAEVITKVLHERAPSVCELNPAISPGLSLVIRKLLAKSPGLRYQTPAELLDDLRRVERAEAPRVDRRRLEALERGARLRRRSWLLAAAGAVVLLVSATLALWGRAGADAAPAPPSALQALAASAAQAQGFAARLEVLRRAAALTVPQAQQRALDQLRQGLEQELGTAIAAFWSGYAAGEARTRAEQWFLAPEHWREPERFVAEEIAPAAAQELGVRIEELPAVLRARFATGQAELLQRASAWQDARDAAWRNRLADFLARELAVAWTVPLEAADFVQAERALYEAVDGFFAAPGMPGREQLSDALRAFAAEREGEAVRAALAVIEREEARVARDLEQRVDAALAELDARRRDLRAARTRELLAALRLELDSEPGSASFRPVHDPWRRLFAALAGFEQRLGSDARLEEAERLDQAARRAYRTLLATGSAAEASGWLAPLTLEDPANAAIREQHLGLLAAAALVERRVTGALLGADRSRELRARLAREREPAGTVVLLRAGEAVQWRVRAGAELRPITPAQVRWADLLTAAGDAAWLESAPASEQMPLRTGLALWLLLSGDEQETMRLLDAGQRPFFTNHVAAALDRLREADPAEEATALELLQGVRRAYASETRDVTQVAASLAAYRERWDDSALAGDARSFLREVDGWVDDERARSKLLDQVRARAPRGAVVEAPSPRAVVVRLSAQALAADGLPAGWTRADAELAFAGEDIDLSEARGPQALELDSGIEQATDASVELEARFPALPDAHRLYLLEAHGALAALALHRDGTPVAALLPADAITRAEELRRALQGVLTRVEEPAVAVLGGARHRLLLRVVATRQRMKATLLLDGVELASRVLPRPPRPSTRVRVMPMQPLRVVGVEVRGTVGG